MAERLRTGTANPKVDARLYKTSDGRHAAQCDKNHHTAAKASKAAAIEAARKHNC